MREETKRGIKHTLTIETEGKTVVTAVTSVPTFDASEMDIVLEEEHLKITGEGLKIDRLDLDSEVLELSGKVKSVTYGKDMKKNLMKRIFK